MNLKKKKELIMQDIDNLEKEYIKRSTPDKACMFGKLKEMFQKGDFYFSDKLYQNLQEIIKYSKINLENYNIQFIIDLISELEDLLASIIYGYYSYDNISYTEKLIQFLDLISTLNKIISLQIIYDFEDKDLGEPFPYNYDDNFYKLAVNRFHEIFSVKYDRKKEVYFSVEISDKKLKISVHDFYERDYGLKKIIDKIKEFNSKKYQFILNQNKVEADKAKEKDWFKTYLSNFYIANL